MKTSLNKLDSAFNCEATSEKILSKAIEKLTFIDWVELLPRYFKQADAIKIWEKLDGSTWLKLIFKDFKFIDIFNAQHAWGKLDNNEWTTLLIKMPELSTYADEYKIWNKLSGWNWCSILVSNIGFSNKATAYNAFKEFDVGDWKILICARPEFAKFAEEIALKEIEKEAEEAKSENRAPKKIHYGIECRNILGQR